MWTCNAWLKGLQNDLFIAQIIIRLGATKVIYCWTLIIYRKLSVFVKFQRLIESFSNQSIWTSNNYSLVRHNAGWSDGRLVIWLVCLLVDCLVGWLVGLLVYLLLSSKIKSDSWFPLPASYLLDAGCQTLDTHLIFLPAKLRICLMIYMERSTRSSLISSYRHCRQFRCSCQETPPLSLLSHRPAAVVATAATASAFLF